MNICENCRCYHPVSGNNNYCGECCIGDTRNPIAVNADITGCCLFEPKPPKSNGDRIRQMTDEELASEIKSSVCEKVENCENDLDCYKCRLLWLKQEVSEDERH